MQLPVFLLPSETNGFPDIGVMVGGGGILETYEAVLKFNRSDYPDNPTVPPVRKLKNDKRGKILIPDVYAAKMALADETFGSNGPSFDCSKATNPMENLICKSKELSGLDVTLQNSFRADRENQSDEARAVTLQTQRQWLKSLSETCNVPANAENDPNKNGNATVCLIALYKDRIKTLQATLLPIEEAESLYK